MGLLVNPEKSAAHALQGRLEQLLQEQGIQTICSNALRAVPDDDTERLLRTAEFIFVLGGDGTLLGAARRLAAWNIPLLGINLGHLGFLTQADPENLEETVQRVVSGAYEVERRLMLEAVVIRHGQPVARLHALNDAGVGKGSFARMVTIDVFVSDRYVDTYRGDGVILSTPTGSTGYSLSAGGPVLTPDLQVMLVTPVCPHTLVSRPFVIADDQRVRLVVHASHEDVGLTVDGQVGVRLHPGDEVHVFKAQHQAQLVKWRDREFFAVLRQKLYGEGVGRNV
ncbi:MAG: NAD(+)/NADH kinase [Alicyclobacillus sp.]|nr:NAD(+)/NADH kinase [Alicyclobacillus sp.]